jgi:hypothetical protein
MPGPGAAGPGDGPAAASGTAAAPVAEPGSAPGGPGATAGAGTDPPAAEGGQAGGQAAALDQLVQDLLAQLQPGWSEASLDSWLYDRYLGGLAELRGLTANGLVRYIDWLIGRLKAAGYRPQSLTRYRSRWKAIAKEKAAERLAAKRAETADLGAAGQLPGRFVVRPRTLPAAHDLAYIDPLRGERRPDAPPLADFETEGILDTETQTFLTNFNLIIDEEVDLQDEFDPRKLFRGRLRIYGRDVPLEIQAKDYADNNRLRAAIIEAAGVQAVVHGKMDLVRVAISTLNWDPGRHQPVRRTVTTDFGWAAAGDVFLVPGGRITASGFVPVDGQTPRRVDLSGEELARHLDLGPPLTGEELRRVKRHIVDDLLQLHQPRVTYSLLAAVAVAILGRFAPDADPFAVWLVGLTGAGKSFLGRLFLNFFGAFPVASGRFASWSATANYVQRQGYFFKDSLYLVDDYKPDVVPHHQIVRVLQNYADRTGRGRLKADATTNTTRPVRGLLVSTGEDVPEHTPSAVARSVVVPVPQQAKDLERGARCVAESGRYRGVTADFVRHLLALGRTREFAASVNANRRHYYEDIAGQQNDSIIS